LAPYQSLVVVVFAIFFMEAIFIFLSSMETGAMGEKAKIYNA